MARPYSLTGPRPAAAPEPDRALLARYAGGDPAAFGALLDRHGPLVLGACKRVLGAASPLADDAFQATFLVLAKKASRLRDPDALPGWLFGVARRVAAAARRKDLVHDKAARAATKPAAVHPPGEWDDLLAVVDDEIAKLPDDLRAAVLLCLYHGKTQDEAAAELGWSVSTLRRRLDRGRELLRSRLTTRGVAPAVAVVAGAVAPSAVPAVPTDLRAASLDLAAGGSVAARLGRLAKAELPRVSAAGVGLAAGGAVLAAGMVAFAAGWFDRPPPPVPPLHSPKSSFADVDMLPDAPEAPLPAKAVARLGTTRLRHGTGGWFGINEPAGLTKLAFLPDGALVSVGGPRVRFWDAAGAERHADGPVIPGDGWAGLRSVPFDRGRKLFVPESDQNGQLRPTGRVWDLTTRTAAPPVTFGRHAGRKGEVIGPTAVSADGKRFFQADGNGAGWVWNTDGSPGAKLAGKVEDLGVAAFLPGGAEVVVSCPDGKFRVWDAATGSETRAFGTDRPKTFASAASPDGRFVGAVGMEGEFEEHVIDSELVVWDAATGAVHRKLPVGELTGAVEVGGSLAFTPDGRHVALATAAEGRQRIDVRWWALDGSDSGRWATRGHGCRPFPLAVSDGPGLVAVGSGEQSSRSVIRVFDAKSGREKVVEGGLPGPVRAVAYASGGREITTTTAAGRFAIFDAATGSLRRFANGPPVEKPQPDHGFDFNAATDTIPPFGPQTAGKRVETVTASVASPDGSRVAVGVASMVPGDGYGRVYVLEKGGRVLWQAAIPDAAAGAVAFSPDGSRLAVGSTVVRLFAADGTPGATLDGHRGAVTALAFAADGRRLVSGSTDTTAVVWDVE
jgi:RNA polymerase sigma factor (sigma-70 family)